MIKGTLHARIKRGEDAKERRRSYLISKLNMTNRRRNDIGRAVEKAKNPQDIKLSAWQRFVNFLKNLFKRAKSEAIAVENLGELATVPIPVSK